ncbi:GNAT family N-acetyltransferase [Terrihabitans sp. B22-R8]|uniref:GNAT family N-acetyltransferase n=1 Tax=Terrihabitans sp. B22-R8 TaxID=3425128 RepID=UPI00403D05A7
MPNIPPGRAALRVNLLPSIASIEAAAWNACANPGQFPSGAEASLAPAYDPFISHEFLSALEDSGSVGRHTGWTPAHLAVEDDTGVLLGVAPVYAKGHSQGEYVFDHVFADALERAGGNYYPKLQLSVPFTPATGRRLLVRPGPHHDQARLALLQGLASLMRTVEASSVHITFMTEEEQAVAVETGLGFLARDDIQFHWSNDGFSSFDDFLAAMPSRKRKAVKRERRDALADGLTIRWITGADLQEAHWDAFWQFYQDTGSRKWGQPYLTRRFFSQIGTTMADNVLLVFAMRGDVPVAGALNLIGGDTLFGRYWGCVEEHPFLHFEVCYHQAIDFALAHGLKRVEAGAQGGHKLARGYRPNLTHSAHLFAHSGLEHAAEDYLARERLEIRQACAALDSETPFKHPTEQQNLDLKAFAPP